MGTFYSIQNYLHGGGHRRTSEYNHIEPRSCRIECLYHIQDHLGPKWPVNWNESMICEMSFYFRVIHKQRYFNFHSFDPLLPQSHAKPLYCIHIKLPFKNVIYGWPLCFLINHLTSYVNTGSCNTEAKSATKWSRWMQLEFNAMEPEAIYFIHTLYNFKECGFFRLIGFKADSFSVWAFKKPK